MNGDEGGFGRASSDETPTEYIPRITDSPVPPAEAQTEVIPRVVYTPPPSSEFPDGSGNGSENDRADQGSEPGTRSARTSERAARSARRRLVVLSGFGEVLITLGAVMALYVVYTLWWTNVEAHKAANTVANQIQQQLAPTAPAGTQPKSVFAPSEGFALMTIPAIGKDDIPVMQGVDKAKVLDKGAVGHYTTPATAMPWDPTGNFAVAAHRRTYGEPFRYINQLRIGDHVVVETTHGWFVYALDKELPQTDPTNIGTIAPIPKGGPFTAPGRYITLTTCTPEWASTYRLIWWGHLVRVDPLNGPPPAELKDPNRHT
ncbi:peptidase C60 sortase A and B [Catenulispora acidiphila DSM 44928]|uniref:Peptidase C60 sortase A and B n=1 Tax=Catenulispora acidiphila (strain DSM 44928 / JCM 14897 / NBRC 102108 / NRRL B-24433 / ID139908) TaxID=479433 RepID=C7QBM6_CATAD|nr:class E sortase [Catenulispora acidiphila]ACU70603.1 peptidase C60 sortase A and B [Catenulispora acidiphila DSM 44928]